MDPRRPFTLIGALANMIVAQHAQGAVINIGVWEHFNVGAPLTVLSILIGIEWLPEGVAARQPLELCYFRRSRLFKTLVLQGITCPTSSSSPSFGLFRSA